MRRWISIAIVLACFACDDGDAADGGERIIVPVGGMGGEGGQGAGGQGEGGQGAGGQGEGGQGEGGQGEGGQGEGGQGEGGQGEGGQGEGGQGEGGQGGEGGGGCSPMCDGRTCGADGCGGVCGPGCGDGDVCADGACIAGECPDGTFDCGGACVDLINDANHCGSCGSACIDIWPADLIEAGVTPQSTRIQPQCAQAECVLLCAESDVGLPELQTDPENCGACGTVCETRAVNSRADACINAACRCTLRGANGAQLVGLACNDRCTLGGANCADGCCPTLQAEQIIPPGRDRVHQFTFAVPDGEGIELTIDCPGAVVWSRGTLYRYLDDGRLVTESGLNCNETVYAPAIRSGHFSAAITALPNDQIVVRSRRIRALAPDLVGPGNVERNAGGNQLSFVIDVPRDGVYRLNQSPRGSTCSGDVQVALLDENREFLELFVEEDDCSSNLSYSWIGQLAAGRYVIVAYADRLEGLFGFSVAEIDANWRREAIYDFDAIPANGNQRILLQFPVGGRYRLSTAGPVGLDCPGDTTLQLLLLSNQREAAFNDDSMNVPGACSQLIYNFAANEEYVAVIAGYDGAPIGPGTLVVDAL